MLEETTTGTITLYREPVTLDSLLSIRHEIEAETGKAPRLFVIGHEQGDIIRDAFLKHQEVTGHPAAIYGVEVHEIDVPSYFQAVTGEEWEVLEEEWRIARAHDRPYSIIERLLARCYLQVRAEITE